MKEYNGHRSYNAWNVALWIDNDEGLYNFVMDCLKQAKNKPGKAATLFLAYSGLISTPDGAKYNHLSVKLALAGLIE